VAWSSHLPPSIPDDRQDERPPYTQNGPSRLQVNLRDELAIPADFDAAQRVASLDESNEWNAAARPSHGTVESDRRSYSPTSPAKRLG